MRSLRIAFFPIFVVLAASLSASSSLGLGVEALTKPKAKQNNAKHTTLYDVAPGKDWERVSGPEFIPIWSEKAPWWSKKEKALVQMKEERRIVVSVVTELLPQPAPKTTPPMPSNRLRLSGAGYIQAPGDFGFARLKEFYRFKDISEYIIESTFDPRERKLFLHVSALKHHARMLFDVVFREVDSRRFILFHIVAGTLQGMRGYVEVKDIGRRESELSMTALYDYDKLPIPQIFIQFGLEVVLKNIAEKLRELVEEQQKIKESK